ncbi:hypothetical protein RMATCC62417_13441 [Rhizopus microsporus]|nr:hypothetical protein RMATCC62417_13441 [Rhizopus microsporus]
MPSFASYPSSLPYFAELHDEGLLSGLIAGLKGRRVRVKKAPANQGKAPANPFMNYYDRLVNKAHTDNGAVIHASTLDSCVDLYYASDRLSSRHEKQKLYEDAWTADPEMTLHIIFYMRSIHRGQSLIDGFMDAFFWLVRYHPRTALANLHVLIDGTVRTDAALMALRRRERMKAKAEREGWELMDDDKEEELLERRDFKTHGYWKDLCTILTIYAQGEITGPIGSDDYKALKWPRMARSANRLKVYSHRRARYAARKNMDPEMAKKEIERSLERVKEYNAKKQVEAKEKRHEIRKRRNDHVAYLLHEHKTYRALHFTIARLFANQLKTDMAQLQKNKAAVQENRLKGKYALGFNLSLAAKWAPSLGNCHDKHTFLATSIAELLFPPKSHQGPGESREHYLNKVRDLYRKQYLIPLREAIDLVEHYLKEGKWDQLDLGHVPAVCLQNNLALFFKHAPDMVTGYLDKVAKGKKKVSGETITPNSLVYRILSGTSERMSEIMTALPSAGERLKEAVLKLANGQWNTLIEGLRNTSLLDAKDGLKERVDLGECIAICDVSGSMYGSRGKGENTPLYAAIGLSLVIANLAKPPFNGALITFSHKPTLFHIDTSLPFSKQVYEIESKMEAGFNTNLESVFLDVLLPMAIENKLKQEDMVKRLFIFTDMEFDENGQNHGIHYDSEAYRKRHETTYDSICRKYREAGYEPPEMVWWNLAGCSSASLENLDAPVTKDQVGVKMLSGLSASMVKTFLDGDDPVDNNSSKAAPEKKSPKRETPLDFVKRAVYHESFKGLIIVD